MVTVGRLVRAYWLTAKDLPSVKGGLQTELATQTAPTFLRDMLVSIIDEIMKSICVEISDRMKQLGIIVKEPLVRRCSMDDYE